MPSPNEIWAKGNCRDHPEPDIFYPERDAHTYALVAAEAKAVCRGGTDFPQCPVILECLFYGLVTQDKFGIWGGLSPRERNALRRSESLVKYRSVHHLRTSPYWTLIDNYLKDAPHGEEEDYGDESGDEDLSGGEEA